MPMYEYRSDEDGEVIELIRPMSQADADVVDPADKGRNFRRIHSVIASSPGAGGQRGVSAAAGGCCPCGKGAAACRSRG